MYIENNLSFLPLAVIENIHASGKSWLKSIETGEWRMQGWPCRVGGEWCFSLTGGWRARRGKLGRTGIKARKTKQSQLMERCEFQIKDFRLIMLSTVNPHFLWVLYWWICLLAETCHPQNQFLYTQYFFSHNGTCTGWVAQKTWVISCVHSQLRLNQIPSSCFSSQTVILFTGCLVSFFFFTFLCFSIGDFTA